MDKKIGQMLCRYIRCDGSDCGADPSSCRYAIGAYKDFEQAFRDAQPEERIAKMLQSGGRVRLWHDQRFLDWDTISNEWVVMDSQGNKGLGCSLYVGADLDKALDALEREGK